MSPISIPGKVTLVKTTVSPVTAYVQGLGIVTDGLVLNLDAGTPLSYPGSGTTWTDLSGNGNNGTLVNGVGFDGGNGGSLVFDGVDDYVNFGNILDFDGSTPFTLSCWFITDNATNNNPWTLIGKTTFSSPILGYQMGFNVATASSGDRGKFGFITVGTGTVVMRRQTVAAYNDNKWYQGTVTYDGSKNRSGILIYINGEQPTLTDYNSSSFTGSLSNNSNLEVGARDGTNQPFPGNISQVSIYNKALTASEITQNYNALRRRYGL